MEKSKFVYIGSLVILAVLLVLAFYHPVITGSKCSEVQRVQLLENGTE
ncbi:MAG: hypothetical protein DNFNHJIP_00667 [Candidatus Argoarchaeum ethanivorans]|uniref:Uncharacterized protein n=1 Tax=Candidatus Argoarchaeum ethanivorans TaxID=2608793 RepID=A0A812A2W2_9EURY|nr:MAG: hypothetical protein DNFNHJIP_00667 [Candidatus Argoarchaeum ethanivorans]